MNKPIGVCVKWSLILAALVLGGVVVPPGALSQLGTACDPELCDPIEPNYEANAGCNPSTVCDGILGCASSTCRTRCDSRTNVYSATGGPPKLGHLYLESCSASGTYSVNVCEWSFPDCSCSNTVFAGPFVCPGTYTELCTDC